MIGFWITLAILALFAVAFGGTMLTSRWRLRKLRQKPVAMIAPSLHAIPEQRSDERTPTTRVLQPTSLVAKREAARIAKEGMPPSGASGAGSLLSKREAARTALTGMPKFCPSCKRPVVHALPADPENPENGALMIECAGGCRLKITPHGTAKMAKPHPKARGRR